MWEEEEDEDFIIFYILLLFGEGSYYMRRIYCLVRIRVLLFIIIDNL